MEMRAKDEERQMHNLKAGPAYKRLILEVSRMNKAVTTTRLALAKMRAVRKKLGLKKFKRSPAMQKTTMPRKRRSRP